MKKKLIGVLIVSPGIIGGIHDGLVLSGLVSPPLILEFIIFIFLISVFSIFFSEQKVRYLRVQNINKELEDKVKQKTRQLSNASKLMWNAYREQKQANKLKAEMLQIAAHDMKSPLQGIVGYSELLMAQFSENKILVERVQKILNSSDHMLTIIQQLLEEEAKKIEQPSVNFENCNFSQLVEYVIDRNYPKALSKQQKLNYKIEPDCIIQGDKTKLVEIADNLISNAIKYTYEKGEITVSVHKTDNNVCLLVKDNGQGLSENDLQMLFKKFQRLSATPTAGEQSTGLGLFIVDKFVKMHGGEIKVNTSVNNGSEFMVILPTQLNLKNC
jgi:signal transduction histidine kinase